MVELASIRSGIGENMRKVKSVPGTIVFASKKRHVSFAFGMGKRWGIKNVN